MEPVVEDQWSSVTRQFKCWSCRRSFPDHGSLVKHTRVEHVDKPKVCRYCPKSYLLEKYLIRHEQTEHGSPEDAEAAASGLAKTDARATPYSCSVCYKSFAYSPNLSLHLRSHAGVRSCVCAVCGKSFARSSSLTNHLRLDHGIQTRLQFVRSNGRAKRV